MQAHKTLNQQADTDKQLIEKCAEPVAQVEPGQRPPPVRGSCMFTQYTKPQWSQPAARTPPYSYTGMYI